MSTHPAADLQMPYFLSPAPKGPAGLCHHTRHVGHNPPAVLIRPRELGFPDDIALSRPGGQEVTSTLLLLGHAWSPEGGGTPCELEGLVVRGPRVGGVRTACSRRGDSLASHAHPQRHSAHGCCSDLLPGRQQVTLAREGSVEGRAWQTAL